MEFPKAYVILTKNKEKGKKYGSTKFRRYHNERSHYFSNTGNDGRAIRANCKQTSNKRRFADCLFAYGWNDAFRHTSENAKENGKSVLETCEVKWRKKKNLHKEPYDDFICGNILNQTVLLDAFLAFACAAASADKVRVIESSYTHLENLFSPYKATGGDHGLCFGHFQKMFNIALKLYVCLYFCRDYLDINEALFDENILNNMQNADCPIDSIILENLACKTNNKEYASHKWSKYGTAKHPQSNYENVQDEISKVVPEGNSRLYYDFVAWKQ